LSALTDEQIIVLAREAIEADARATRAAMESLNETFVKVTRLFASCSGKVLVTGSGTSGAIAIRAAHLLSVCGTPAFYLSPADGLHGGLGALQHNDIVLAVSKGGSSAELNEFCHRAKSLCGALVAITASVDSSFATLADHVIALRLEADMDLGTVVATGSSLATAAIVDSLAAVCRIARDYSWDKLLFTHPSGAVGREAGKSLPSIEVSLAYPSVMSTGN
jgi:D-arabinose 5-phosphate isomerase GutQ